MVLVKHTKIQKESICPLILKGDSISPIHDTKNNHYYAYIKFFKGKEQGKNHRDLETHRSHEGRWFPQT